MAFAAMRERSSPATSRLVYVAEHGSSSTPALFNVATLWSALEGSIILWVLVLAATRAARGPQVPQPAHDPLVGWAMATLFVITGFFFALMVGPANPFPRSRERHPHDGPGPNPLLQNHPLMAFHPPMLYLGYVGFTVPFAFAIAALSPGGSARAGWSRPAGGRCSPGASSPLGIILGAWWAYEVLGWGGYWGWDPVENASFLPWLTGTAYLHSVMVQERRGMLRVWNLSLLCATFSLTILGTFLTRSGVLDSVHAFTESHIGPWLLSFFGVVVLAVGLIGWRGDRLRSPGSIDSPVSARARSSPTTCCSRLRLRRAARHRVPAARRGGERRPHQRGPSVLRPHGHAHRDGAAHLMAIAPVLPWRKASGELLSQRLFWPFAVGVAGVALAVLLGGRGLTRSWRSSSAASPAVPPPASWCSPPAARAGAASSGGPTAA
jgi:cytochrome c-type biogenesis protein CcmF